MVPALADLHERDTLRKEISALRQQLATCTAERRTAFATLEQLHAQLRLRIEEVRQFKSERDSLTAQVKEVKKQRDALHMQVQHKREQAEEKETQSKTRAFSKGRAAHPSALRREIERLEQTIETEAVPFAREQQLMKRIKDCKRQLEEWKKASSVQTAAAQALQEFASVRQEEYRLHKQVQDVASQSQTKHNAMFEHVKELETLQAQIPSANAKFQELRIAVRSLVQQLRKKEARARQLGMEAEQRRLVREEHKRQQEINLLKEKERFVKEKMARGGKLTTEDLLVLQGADEVGERE